MSEFTPFPRLAAEIRMQIWRDTLPEAPRPSIYAHRRGCWRARRLVPGDKDYDPINLHRNEFYDFDYNLLESGPISLPNLFVNKEARAVTMAWVRQCGLRMLPGLIGNYPSFVKPFDPNIDILFLSREGMLDGLHERTLAPHPRLLDRQEGGFRSEIKNVAIHQQTIASGILPWLHLESLLESFPGVQTMYVIWGDQAQGDFSQTWNIEPTDANASPQDMLLHFSQPMVDFDRSRRQLAMKFPHLAEEDEGDTGLSDHGPVDFSDRSLDAALASFLDGPGQVMRNQQVQRFFVRSLYLNGPMYTTQPPQRQFVDYLIDF
ncbi:hypothetical protein ANO11243_082050 [Dothideomycetidae sp. 11243]|nr:hypothetical protein ANO11243_082050 [fungal sp. No.11243]